MNIGFIGLGKLGFPCASAIAWKGHNVIGYDVNKGVLSHDPRPYKETGPGGKIDFNEWYQSGRMESTSLFNSNFNSNMKFASGYKHVVDNSDIIFLAIQTPHEAGYEGITRLPANRVDFDYKYVAVALSKIAEVIEKPKHIVIISTVLPGTFKTHLKQFCNDKMKICYNPFFIAMGTTIYNFLNPEFVLFGTETGKADDVIKKFYRTITAAPVYETTIENAELIKVAYNTFIGLKIGFANTLMEICHKTPGCDVDAVTDALKLATDRLISPRYLSGGMGDAGGCHGRDQIAMSYLARKLNLSSDIFESIMKTRERQAEWLADLMIEEYKKSDSKEKQMVIFGYSYKPESNLIYGSSALLVRNILKEKGYNVWSYDPIIDQSKTIPRQVKDINSIKFIILVGTKHRIFKSNFPCWGQNNIIIDPFRFVEHKDLNLTVIPVGINEKT